MLTKRLLHIDTLGRVVDSKDRIIFFPLDQFKRDICRTDNCFICGRSENETMFNKEHILPDWLLKKHNLYSETITMLNEKQIKYGSYVIPCCVECNSDMGRIIEQPILSK